MPLFSDDIAEARSAYSALEARALSAERRAEVLQGLIAGLLGKLPELSEISVLRDRVITLEAENAQIRTQAEQLARLKTEALLHNLIQAFGLAAAIGEATMPDRAISSIEATVLAHIVPDPAGVGIRFQPPELGGSASGLSSASFALAKVPPSANASALRNLYVVLEGKQRVYASPFWARFEAAQKMVAEIVKIFAETGSWSFSYLVQKAAFLGALESTLAAALSAAMPREAVSPYGAAVDALLKLTSTLGAKANPVAGDLFALTAALDTTTRTAEEFLR